MSVSTLCLQGPLFATTSENHYTDSVLHMCKLSTNWLPFKLSSMKFQENKESTYGVFENLQVGPRCRKVEVKRPKKRCKNLPRQVSIGCGISSDSTEKTMVLTF